MHLEVSVHVKGVTFQGDEAKGTVPHGDQVAALSILQTLTEGLAPVVEGLAEVADSPGFTSSVQLSDDIQPEQEAELGMYLPV